MKRFFSNLWCLALAITLSTACSNDDQMPEETPQTAQAISAEEALENLNTFFGHTSTRGPKQLPDSKEMLVFRNNDATRTGEATGEAYIVNFKEGGYAILGGNTGQAPVIAVVERGSMTPEQLISDLKTTQTGEVINALTLTNANIANHIFENPVGVEVKKSDLSRAAGLESQDPLIVAQWGTDAQFSTNRVVMAAVQMLTCNAWRHSRYPQAINGKARPWNSLINIAQKVDYKTATALEKTALSSLISDVTAASKYTNAYGQLDYNIVSMLNKIGGYWSAESIVISNGPGQITKPEKIREMIFVKKFPAIILSQNLGNPTSAYIMDGWMFMQMANGATITTVHHNYANYGEGDGWYDLNIAPGSSLRGSPAPISVLLYE